MNRPARRPFTVGLFLIACALSAACGSPEWIGGLEPIPALDLGSFEPGVRNQIELALARVDGAQDSEDRAEAASAYGALGAILYNYELYGAATVALENALRLEPESRRWHYYLAIVNQANGELAAAAEGLERAVALAPGYLPARVRLGEVWIASQEPAKARAELEQALELDPECALAHYFLGSAMLASGDGGLAIEHLERALALQPQATAVHHLLAQAYRELGEQALAQKQLELRGDEVVRLEDRLFLELGDYDLGAAARIRRGARSQVAGDLDTALDEYRLAVAADPENAQARQSLAGILVRRGETRAAIAEYRAAQRLVGEDPLVLSNLGAVLMAAGDNAEAETLLRRAVELDPALANARLALGALLTDAGRPAEALAHYRALLDRDRSNVEGLLGLARALAGTGDSRGAVEALTRALEVESPDPTRARLHAELGSVLARRREGPQALEQLDKALGLDPELVAARFTRANLLGTMGRFRDAADEYVEVLRRAPASVPARLGGTTAWAMAGEYEQARECLADGLEIAPDPRLEHALARLLATAPAPDVRDPERGLKLAQSAHATLSTMESAETLALALAAAGKCSESVGLERQILDQARRQQASGQGEQIDRGLAERVAARLNHYERSGSCLTPWLV